MRNIHSIRAVPSLVAGLLPVVCVHPASAQGEPSTIPIVVAQAMAFEPSFLGRPQFFSGQLPPDWPTTLVPPGAKVLGGGVVGNATMYRVRAAVFEFAPGFSLREVLEPLLARAGYAKPAAAAVHPREGGFVETAAPPSPNAAFCNGSTAATFGAVDTVGAPHAVALYLLEGEPGKQLCVPQQNAAATARRFPVTVPLLMPPPGAMLAGGGSSWDGSGGEMTSSFRTTMPTDSILAHYSAQLVAGGWKREGRPGLGDGVSVQRFALREGQDPWTGALIVVAAGDRRDVVLRVTKVE